MRAVLAVGLAVMMVAASGVAPAAAAGTGPGPTTSGPGTTTGATAPSGASGTVGAVEPTNETGNDTDPPISVHYHYNLTPDDPGQILITATFEFDPNDSAIQDRFADEWISIDQDDVLVRQSGFERLGSNVFKWDGESEWASMEVRKLVNDSGEYGMRAVDVGEWAFFSDATFAYDEATIREYGGTFDRSGTPAVTVGNNYGFVGTHDVERTSANGQTFRIVVPDAASPEASITELNWALVRSSYHLDVGGKDDTVTAFIVMDPIRSGGAALDDEFWVTDAGQFDAAAPTWHHEYVHTRQSYPVESNASWTVEAFAQYYAAMLSWRQNTTSFEEFRAAGNYRYGNRDDQILSNRSTWEDLTQYRRGEVVTAALDYRIREATDGQRSLVDVFRRMNRHPNTVTLADLQAMCEEVADRDFDEFFDRYVRGGEFPGVPNDPSLYEFADTTRIDGHVSTAAGLPDSSGTIIVSNDTVEVDLAWGTDVAKAVMQDSHVTRQVDTPGSVSIPVETGRVYSAVYAEYGSDERTFRRNGVPDFYTLDRDVDATRAPGSFGTAQLPEARPVNVTVYDDNGTRIGGSTVGVLHEGNYLADLPTDDGGQLQAGPTPGIELAGEVGIWAEPPGGADVPIHLWHPHNLSVTGASEMHVVAATGRTGIGGSAVVGTYADVGDTVRVVAYPYGDRDPDDDTVTVDLTVDGDRVATRNVTVPGGNSQWIGSVTETTFNVTFEHPGTHRIQVGTLPAHELWVGPGDDDSGGDDGSNASTFAGYLAGGYDGETFEAAVDPDADRVTLTLSGPEDADFDLYATADGREPTRNDYDAKSWSLDSDETIELDGEAVGDSVGLLVDSYRGEGNFTLEVEVEHNDDDGTGNDTGEVRRETGHLEATGDADRYWVDPAGSGDHLVIELEGAPAADFDLFVTFDGREPTTDDYDRVSMSLDSDERVVLDADRLEGSAGVVVYAWWKSGNYTLRAYRTDDPESADTTSSCPTILPFCGGR